METSRGEPVRTPDPVAAAGRGRPFIASFLATDGQPDPGGLAANVAWLIAAAGHDVLLIDGSPRTSGIAECLSPFLADEALAADDLGIEIVRAADEESELRRYVPAGATRPGVLDVLDTVGARLGADSAGAIELRMRLLSSTYAFVLTHARSANPGGAPSESVLADLVVLCFPAQRREIAKAASMALEIRRAQPVRQPIVAVSTFFDDSDATFATDHAAEIHSVMLRTLRGGRVRDETIEQVVLPGAPQDPVVAALAYDEDRRRPLLAAYQKLTAAVTDGRVRTLPPLAESARERYRRMVGGPTLSESGAEPVEIVYRVPDRPWADWVRSQLDGAGLPSRLRCYDLRPDGTDASVVVVVVGAVPISAEQARGGMETVELHTRPEASGRRRGGVSVAGCHARQARARLLAAFGLVGAHDGRGDRLPGSRRGPTGHGASVEPLLVDRGAELEVLRDHFNGSASARVVLRGPAGTGRSTLATVYASRFGHQYDVVWMIPGHDRQSARAALEALGTAVGAGGAVDAATGALRQLADDEVPYLLIYDDADDLSRLHGLLPVADTGHVMVIQEPGSPTADDMTVLEVGPLQAAEAYEALRLRIPDLDEGVVAAVVDSVGTGPLSLRVAAGLLAAATRELQAAGAPFGDASRTAAWALASQLPPTGPRSLADLGRVLFRLLEESREGRVTATLLRMCAYLSPHGTALSLLRSTAWLDHLTEAVGEADGDVLLDGSEIELLLAGTVRLGLCDIDWGPRARLRMHPAIPAMILDSIEQARAERLRRLVLLALAAYAPSDAEQMAGEGRNRLGELGRHLGSSGALSESGLPAVRRWVVSQLGFVVTTGDADQRAAAIATVVELRERWAGQDDRLSARLAQHHADLLRSLGRDAEAFEVDQAALLTHPQVGSSELRTVMARRGLAGDLRGLGRFDQALAEDRGVYRTLRTLLGADHRQTLLARHNLALSSYLAGVTSAAMEDEAEIYRIRQRLYGPDDPLTWWSALDLGVYRRELGDLGGAQHILAEASDRLRQLGGETHQQTLRATAELAATQRRAGRHGRARDLARQACAAYERLLGSDSLVTQGARLGLSLDLARTNDVETAVIVAEESVRAFRQKLGSEHPFTAVCLVNHAAVLRSAGRAEDAAEAAREALETLTSRVSEVHPWSIAARINLANAYADGGRLDDARAVDEIARGIALEMLPLGHHYLTLLSGSPIERSPQRPDVDIEVPTT